jgi:hypothetical protein
MHHDKRDNHICSIIKQLATPPDNIIASQLKPKYNKMKIEFGSYVQVHERTLNNAKSRTLGSIALYPAGSKIGAYYFISLANGKRIHRKSWTEILISNLVISLVEATATEEHMPDVTSKNMINLCGPDKQLTRTSMKNIHSTEGRSTIQFRHDKGGKL